VQIRIIDAFTDEPFAGNPAGVCLLDDGAWPAGTWMQAVAAELNLSETAFARPAPDSAAEPDAAWELRWFTPTVEVDLCGHATLATAHAMREAGLAAGTVRFATRSGVLVTHAATDGTITLDFPAASITDVAPRVVEVAPPDRLAAILGAAPTALHGTGALGDLLVVLPDSAAVSDLAPDLSAVAELSSRAHLRGVIVTASADPGHGHDFVSRFFAPAVGVPEDPVTGSAHTALAPYWSDRLGRDGLVGRQVSARGGVVHTEVHGDRVHLTGRAVTVLDGVLLAR
jgi:PhzF family phenazine biosynthesis protein